MPPPPTTSGHVSVQLCETKPATLLNDFYTKYHQPLVEKPLIEFSIFPNLSFDISSAIWTCVLQRHRLITINVIDKDDTASPTKHLPSLSYMDKNRLGNTISGKGYRISITSNHRPHPLLRVCRESRRAALQFYRLHIPYDFKIHGERRCAPELFVDLLHDAKAYDPLGVGIQNIGVGDLEPNDLQLPMNPSNLAPLALSTFTTTLSSLKRVFFHHIVQWDARQMFEAMDMREVRYNRSYPLNSQTEAFDLLNTDPRPIDADLTKVSVGLDPRQTLWIWREMEGKFQIRHSQPVEFIFLLTAPAGGLGEDGMIATRADANNFLQREETRWAKSWRKGHSSNVLALKTQTPLRELSTLRCRYSGSGCFLSTRLAIFQKKALESGGQ